MIKKEDFEKKFPLTVKGCVVDEPDILDTCCIDSGEIWNCAKAKDYKTKEECPYWKDLPNFAYIEDVWNWIDKYQKQNPT